MNLACKTTLEFLQVFYENPWLWNTECRPTVPHNAGGTYSGLAVIGVSIKVELWWKCNHY